jgi:hypothetical protein
MMYRSGASNRITTSEDNKQRRTSSARKSGFPMMIRSDGLPTIMSFSVETISEGVRSRNRVETADNEMINEKYSELTGVSAAIVSIARRIITIIIPGIRFLIDLIRLKWNKGSAHTQGNAARAEILLTENRSEPPATAVKNDIINNNFIWCREISFSVFIMLK